MKPEEIRDDRQMRSLTGLSQEQFTNLTVEFERDYQAYREACYADNLAKGMRQRRLGGGRKGNLPSVKDKLFFTLVYFKTYPTFDVLGTQFGMARSKANENLHTLAPILMNTLVRLGVMPHRRFSSIEEMKAAFQGIARILIDVTERRYRRSQDADKQRELYSGKKSVTPSKTP